MFTGIVEEVGTVRSVVSGQISGELAVRASKVLGGTRIGDSIAVNGVCLTVTSLLPDGFTALSEQPGQLELAFDSTSIPLPEAIRLLSSRMEITDFSVRETSVDDMVVSLYEDLHL